MAPDSDDEWLAELLTPAKRPRVSDDGDALLFFYDLLKLEAPPTPGNASMPVPQVTKPETRPDVPAGFALLPAATRLAVRPAIPAPAARPAILADTKISFGHVNHDIIAASEKPPGPTSVVRPASLTKEQRLANVVFRLPQSNLSGAILAHAEARVHSIVKHGPTIFKIGITTDPAHRWGNCRYGYLHDLNNYQQMLILSEDESAGAAMLEASLINTSRHTPGCRNTAPRGENARQGCMVFHVYSS